MSLARLLLVLGVLIAPTGVAGPAAAASSAGGTPPTASDLARSIARPWPARQRADGGFPDALADATGLPRDPYGDAMLGYGLLGQGLRDDDGRAVDSALRGLGHAVAHPVEGRRAIFEDLALAGAYNLARAKLPADPRFLALRPAWQRRLQRIRVRELTGTRPYYNWHLVEAVGVLELVHSGIGAGGRTGTVLAGPRRARRLAETLLARGLARAVRPYVRGSLGVVSDPPLNPPAYHAFSLGLLARAIDLQGARASPAARALLSRAARASGALAAPDGDLALFGRSQEQSWALAMTAYGAEAAARLRGATPGQGARDRALADRALARLSRLHLLSDGDLALTPALRADPVGAIAGLDGYVSTTAYTGLTLVGLGWAAERHTPGLPSGALGADAPGSVHIGRGPSSFAAVRTGDVWFAVKQGPAVRARPHPDYRGDLRYAAGLLAVKRRGADGAWSDALALRPKTRGAADPLIPALRRGGKLGRPEHLDLRLGRAGTVAAPGGFRTTRGRWLRRGVTVRYTAIACGVRITVPTRRGDRFEQTAFVRRGAPGPLVEPRSFVDGDRRLGYSLPARVALRGTYASGLDPALTRARIRFAPADGRPLVVDVCQDGTRG